MTAPLLILDVAHAAWAAWHARTSQSGAFDLLRAKLDGITRGRDRVILAVDLPPYERSSLFAGYKAKRVNDVDGRAAVKGFIAALRDAGWTLAGSRGHEADDVIATLVTQAKAAGVEVDVMTGDKDLWCLAPACGLYSMDGQRIDDAACVARFGVACSLLPDLLSIAGDTIDNIPGARGVGNDGAAKLLRAYGSLAAVLSQVPASADDIADASKELAKLRAKARRLPAEQERKDLDALADEAARQGELARLVAAVHASRADVELAARLVALRTDLPLDLAALIAACRADQEEKTDERRSEGASQGTDRGGNADGQAVDERGAPGARGSRDDGGDDLRCAGGRAAAQAQARAHAEGRSVNEAEYDALAAEDTRPLRPIEPEPRAAAPLAVRSPEPAPIAPFIQAQPARSKLPTMTLEEAMTSVPAALAGALVDAQGRVSRVAKDSTNTFHRYKYAAAEDMIDEARSALNAAGLALMSHWKVDQSAYTERETRTDRGDKTIVIVGRVVVSYTLIHKSGQALRWITSTPIIPENGRPEDKAEMAALTANLGYTLRQLLLIPRGDDDGNAVDQRDDRSYRPYQPPQRRTA